MEQSDKTTHLIEAIRVLKELQSDGQTMVHQEIRKLVEELMRELSK